MANNDKQPRQPSGSPIGGEWDSYRASRGQDLDRYDSQKFIQERRDYLASQGMVRAAWVNSLTEAKDRRRLRGWWEQSFATAEYNGPGEQVAKMPDDWTPKMTSGRALSGHRRTHRMHYRIGDGGGIRMPSRTAIVSYMDAEGVGTLDVPVTYTPADPDSPSIQAWVRVSRNVDGVWAASTLGLGAQGSTAEVMVAESVVATMERRNLDIESAQQLADRRRARQEAQGAMPYTVSSSFINEAGYDHLTGTCFVTMKEGGVYGYTVPPQAFEALVLAHKGSQVYHAQIRGKQQAEAYQCERCGNYVACLDTTEHVCPTGSGATTIEGGASLAFEAALLSKGATPSAKPWSGPTVGHSRDDEAKKAHLAGWRRAVGDTEKANAMLATLDTCTDSQHVPHAYKDAMRRPKVRNGENGTLSFDGVSGSVAEKLESQVHNVDAGSLERLRVAKQFNGVVEAGGFVTKDGAKIDSLRIFDPRVVSLIKRGHTKRAMTLVKEAYGVSGVPNEFDTESCSWREGTESAWLWYS